MTERTCNCYMLNAPDSVVWCARWGQHDKRCPVYRESLDPVDREKDISCALYYAQTYGVTNHG